MLRNVVHDGCSVELLVTEQVPCDPNFTDGVRFHSSTCPRDLEMRLTAAGTTVTSGDSGGPVLMSGRKSTNRVAGELGME